MLTAAKTDYEEAMYEIVADCYALSSQVLSQAEKMAKTKDWARLLFDLIPESELKECFDYARYHHDSPFAVSGYEIQNAYIKLHQKEWQEKQDKEFYAKRFGTTV